SRGTGSPRFRACEEIRIQRRIEELPHVAARSYSPLGEGCNEKGVPRVRAGERSPASRESKAGKDPSYLRRLPLPHAPLTPDPLPKVNKRALQHVKGRILYTLLRGASRGSEWAYASPKQ